MCLYVCMCVTMCMYVSVCVSVFESVFVCVCIYVCAHVYVCLCVCVQGAEAGTEIFLCHSPPEFLGEDLSLRNGSRHPRACLVSFRPALS